jgi:hypothetical protein
MKRNAKFILSLLLVVLIAVGTLAACDENNVSQTPETTITAAIVTERTFTLEVTDDEGNTASQSVTTTETTVGAALYEAGITDSSEFVTVINGIRADFVEDGYWWAFYINGEMAMVGVGGTDVEEGGIYAFIYTPA